MVMWMLFYNNTRACGAAVAQRTHNPLVVGSNPTGPILKNLTRIINHLSKMVFCMESLKYPVYLKLYQP